LTVREALTEAAARLAAVGIDSASLDAALLLAEALHTTRTRLVLAYGDPLAGEHQRLFDQLIGRRLSGEPVAYILGRKEFRGLDFTVTQDTLIPRPDTETLVEAALEMVTVTFSVLDLCTGSGAVAIALKHERPELAVYASDISPAALAVARANAARLLQEDGRFLQEDAVTFIQSDLFAAFRAGVPGGIPRRFGLIVSNPPYVPAAVIPTLAPEVRSEPLLALDGGVDGLDLIRRIIGDAREHLVPGGALLLEADSGQMETIAGILAAGGYTGVKTYKDLSQKPRVICGVSQN
jgi:release factor glutamine methyltransferase